MLRTHIYFINFVAMSLAWSTSSFAYFMIGFYVKYIPGDMFTNVIVSSISELISTFLSGIVATLIGTKITLIGSFILSCLAGLGLIMVDVNNTILITCAVLLTKFGISSAFNLCYLITADYFPLQYTSSVFGACNVIARLMSILSPMIAEIPNPFPMLIFALFCFISTFAGFFLKKSHHEEIL